jgi:hypothetical protein
MSPTIADNAGPFSAAELNKLRGWLLSGAKASECLDGDDLERLISTLDARDAEIERLRGQAQESAQALVKAGADYAALDADRIPFAEAYSKRQIERAEAAERALVEAWETAISVAEDAACFDPPQNADEAQYFEGWRKGASAIATDLKGLYRMTTKPWSAGEKSPAREVSNSDSSQKILAALDGALADGSLGKALLRSSGPKSKVICPKCNTLYIPGERHGCAAREATKAETERDEARAEVEEAKRLYYVAHHEDRPARKEARLGRLRIAQLEEALKAIRLRLHGPSQFLGNEISVIVHAAIGDAK